MISLTTDVLTQQKKNKKIPCFIIDILRAKLEHFLFFIFWGCGVE